MAITPQIQAAIDRASSAIVAANPAQNEASWNKTLVGYANALPPPGTYYRSKLSRLIDGTLSTKTLTQWGVAPADVTALKTLWGV